jgi:hypothetical protein
MKIIFLDIDGVLNNELWFKKGKEKGSGTTGDYEKSMFDPKCIEQLNWLTDETQAKIVVSSSWRTGRSLKQLIKLFNDVGITGEVIGKTPLLNFKVHEGVEYNYSVPRGCEIKAWLELNKDKINNKMSKIRYVILDDDSDMLYWQRRNYFRIDPYCGLTNNVAYRAIMFLNK